MTFDSEKLLDETGRKILRELQKNARIPFAELGRLVNLSAPAVAERVRKLEEAGIIEGYHAVVHIKEEQKLLLAFVRLNTTPASYPRVLPLIKSLSEVKECHHVTGEDSFILKLVASSTAELETLIARISQFGETTTAIVLSSPVISRTASPEP